ncbi:hypothetical protein [Williamsia muralis]|uniref:hypothetical protein n=1 Tax=Williamsia marianensis TaxID=85044 RepID=UPI001057E3BF|nr:MULTISPECIES: hypothetical protein [Williamsia]
MSRSRTDKNRARKARLAADERRREEHARLVLERHGDPHYVQRDVDPSSGDITLAMSPEHPQAAEMADVFAALQRDFVERFGREPGPNDPLLVDPDATVPTPMSADAFDSMLDRLADGVDDPVIRAKVLASKDVGYILTEDTLHLFSAYEIDLWEAALDRHLDDLQ